MSLTKHKFMRSKNVLQPLHYSRGTKKKQHCLLLHLYFIHKKILELNGQTLFTVECVHSFPLYFGISDNKIFIGYLIFGLFGVTCLLSIYSSILIFFFFYLMETSAINVNNVYRSIKICNSSAKKK